jgi:hypothetical protein
MRFFQPLLLLDTRCKAACIVNAFPRESEYRILPDVLEWLTLQFPDSAATWNAIRVWIMENLPAGGHASQWHASTVWYHLKTSESATA